MNIIDGYTPAEIAKATDWIVLESNLDYFPKPNVFKKALDYQRSRRSIPLDTGRSNTWEDDHAALRAWVKGYALNHQTWKRIAPHRMVPGGIGDPAVGREQDEFLEHWLPTCSKRAIAAFCDDLVLVRDEPRRGESPDITNLRKWIGEDFNPMAGALRPSEKVDLIEREMAA